MWSFCTWPRFSENSLLLISWLLVSRSSRPSLPGLQQVPCTVRRWGGWGSVQWGSVHTNLSLWDLCFLQGPLAHPVGLYQPGQQWVLGAASQLIQNTFHFTSSSERAVIKVTKFIAWIYPRLFFGGWVGGTCLPASFIHNFQKSYIKSSIASC